MVVSKAQVFIGCPSTAFFSVRVPRRQKMKRTKKNSHVSRTDGKMYIICIATALALGVDL